jgi:hypothetical protein
MLTAHVSSVIAISCARIYLVVEGQWETDESWYYDPFLAVENAEIGATLFALSVPALKPLFGNLFIKIDSTISSNFGRSSRSRAMSTHRAIRDSSQWISTNEPNQKFRLWGSSPSIRGPAKQSSSAVLTMAGVNVDRTIVLWGESNGTWSFG